MSVSNIGRELTSRLAERVEPFRQVWCGQLDVRCHGHRQCPAPSRADQEYDRVHLAARNQGGCAYVRSSPRFDESIN